MANHQSNFTSNFGETGTVNAALVLSVNGVDYTYRPTGDDTSVSVPTVEKHNYDEGSLVGTLTRILASNGDPIIRKSGHEYRFITSNDTSFVFASVIDGLVETLSISKSDGAVTTATSSTVKFVDPSLTQVTEAIAAGYLPMIKRMAGQGNRYFHLQWVGSEARFTSIGEEEISRLVITGDSVTETTDKLRDVVNISTINGGSYVSNKDYESALDGANDNRVVILQSASASVTSKSYLVAVGSIGLRFIDVANDKVRLITVAPTQTENGHAVTYEDLANGSFTDIVAFDFTDYTDSVDGNIAYPIANNKMQIQSDWDGSLNNQAVFIAPSDTSNNAIVKLENVQTTINWNVQIWNHSKTALLPLVPGSATVFKKDASYVIHLYGDKAYVSQVGGGGGGSGTTYSAGYGIDLTNDTISVNTDIIATKESVESSLQSKQDKLTPGSNIDITNNIISATGIPTKTSELVNNSGFIFNDWKKLDLVKNPKYESYIEYCSVKLIYSISMNLFIIEGWFNLTSSVNITSNSGKPWDNLILIPDNADILNIPSEFSIVTNNNKFVEYSTGGEGYQKGVCFRVNQTIPAGYYNLIPICSLLSQPWNP